MFKSLIATCLTALSVNNQPLSVSPSLEPSRAITEASILPNTTYILRLESGNYFDNDLFTPLLPSNSNFILIDFNSNLNYVVNNEFDYIFNITTFHDCYVYFDDEDFLSIQFSFGTHFLTFETQSILSTFTYDYYFEFIFSTTENVTGFFYSEFLPYLTIVENPYTPPSKSNLYRLLYDFYYSIFNDDDLTAITSGYNMPFDNWLAHTCTIATLITLIVVAFFFLRWLFKVISGLILLKR